MNIDKFFSFIYIEHDQYFSNISRLEKRRSAMEAIDERALRKKRIVDAVKQQTKPDRVPLVSNAFTWKICDDGATITEAYYDFSVMERVVVNHHKKYDFDGYFDYGLINAIKFADTLGKGFIVINDEKNSMNFVEKETLTDEKYNYIAEKGFAKYIFEDYIPDKYGYTSTEEAFDRIIKATEECRKYYDYYYTISGIMNDEYKVPDLIGMWYYSAFEYFPWALRGLRGTGVDMRRRPDEMEAALKAMDEFVAPPFYAYADSFEDNDNCVFAHSILMMAHSIMNAKQFERFYWPILKRYIDTTIEKKQLGFIYSEASLARLFDFFRDIPKGCFGLLAEQDPIPVLQENLPNMAISGGLSSDLLGQGTKEECIEEAKRLLDTVCVDGTFLFGQKKMLSFPNDAKGENLKAVNDYVREHGVY